jgi:predicted TIM-barrel fold metal-dependent hydrolase
VRVDHPLLDAHHHLWDLSLGRHPWLTDPDGPLKTLGDLSFLRRNYLPADYLADIGQENVAGSVYVEAHWDRAAPIGEEMRWVAALQHPQGIAARLVGWVPLASPDIAAHLDTLTQTPGVVGVRETIRWHPDPTRAWAPAGIADDPAWRRGAAELARRGLLLELLMNPYQADEVARLAADLPALTIVVNHCSSPMDRDEAGIARWRHGLAAMGRMPNVHLKLSNYGAYGPDRTPSSYRATLATCIEAFTPARAVFATDYPVGRRAMTYREICAGFRDAIADYAAAEQRALLHDNAALLYRFDNATSA